MNHSWLHPLQLLYLMLPAYLANMAPPFLRFWHGWNPPIQQVLLGSHKTVLGFAAGVVVGVLVAALQELWLQGWLPNGFWLIHLGPGWLIGLLFGTGAMAGDALKSLFKRRLGIAAGQPWLPFDQLDFVLGALVLIWPFAQLDMGDVGLILGLSFLGDLAVNRLAFQIGIKTTPW